MKADNILDQLPPEFRRQYPGFTRELTARLKAGESLVPSASKRTRQEIISELLQELVDAVAYICIHRALLQRDRLGETLTAPGGVWALAEFHRTWVNYSLDGDK